MDEYIDYQRCSDRNQLNKILEYLEENGIPFKVVDNSEGYSLAATDSPLNQQITLQIRESDFARTDQLLADSSVAESIDHYLYTFSDEDIIAVVANAGDWTPEEQIIAKQIVAERGLKIAAKDIQQARANDSKKEKRVNLASLFRGIGGWYLTIGILSFLNTLIVAFHLNVNFLLGLGITQLVDRFFRHFFGGHVLAIPIVISALASGFFVLMWYLAKQQKEWAVLVGLIVYGADSLIYYFGHVWIGLGFHILCILFIAGAYLKIKEELYNKTEG